MTARAIVIGLVLGLVIAAVGYLNDWGLKLPGVACNLVPLSVFGFLVAGIFMLNPLIRLLRARQLSAGEWCVILALMMAACIIPGPGLMWQFTDVLVDPHFNAAKDPAVWKKHRLLEYTPSIMLVDPSAGHEAVVDGFHTGVGRQTQFPPVSAVPWAAFGRTLSFWIPFLALGMIATVCVMLILHGQWSKRERLRYPVAEFATELLEGVGESPFARILHNRLFWTGFAVAFGILIINGLKCWFTTAIEIPLRFDMTILTTKWPKLTNIYGWQFLFNPTIFFVGLGFAYFVSSDVSFSVGISHMVFAVACLVAVDADLPIRGHYIGGSIWDYQVFGSYLGMTLTILYIGRRFYGSVLLRTFWLQARDKVEGSVAWAARVGLLAAAAMVVVLNQVLGLDWMLAAFFVVLTGMLYMVLTRINVETGLIIIQPKWQAIEVIAGLLGFVALGPNMFIILAILSVVTHIDPRSCLMPMVANSLRFSEPKGLRLGKLSAWMTLAVLAALVVGMFATIYVQYGFGDAGHFWWAPSVGNFSYEVLMQNLSNVNVPFTRDTGASWYGFSWAHIQPSKMFLSSAGVGLALVLVCSFLRLRFPRWPIHPLLFLIWGTDTVTPLCFSFLLGWIIKSFVARFGGGAVFKRYKPFFVGLVAGELLAGITWAVVGLISYLLTGIPISNLPVFTGDIPRH